LTGNVSSAQTLWIRGSTAGSNTTVTAPTSFTNAGTIRMESIDSGYNSDLRLTTGTLTNNGTIVVNAGTGGGRNIFGGLLNNGHLQVMTTLTVSGAGGFENAAAGVIDGNGVLTVTSTTFRNGGQLNPGSSPAVFTITGAYTQLASGTINVEIGGLTAGTQFDQIKISAAATLAGVLNLSRIGGYEPNLGDAFDVLTYSSRVGTFTTINGLSIGNGKKFSPTYGATKLTLTVVAE
jgi:hypothetical protein